MLRILNSLPLLYLVMLWPGRFAIWALYDEGWYYAQMMFETGFWSFVWLIITVAVTPALAIIRLTGKGHNLGRWLLQRRRHFGLGSFVFACLHVAHYAQEIGSLGEILAEAVFFEFTVGWIAWGIFLALAITSNGWSVRQMGRGWKKLHYAVYPAAAFAFLHWYLFDPITARFLFWLGIFVGVKLIHGALRNRRRKPTTVGQT